jgi:hypothetical protein
MWPSRFEVFGRPIDGTSRNCDDIACATAYTHGVIIVLVTIETREISIGVSINVNSGCRLDDHSLILGSNKVAADLLDGDFV